MEFQLKICTAKEKALINALSKQYVKGPDKESCAATHREANGITACQIIEFEGGMYDIFIGENQKLTMLWEWKQKNSTQNLKMNWYGKVNSNFKQWYES